jgi:starch synthase
MKGGLKFADRITTVSRPTPARSRRRNFGFGLDGVIRSRQVDVVGHPQRVDPQGVDPGAGHGAGHALRRRSAGGEGGLQGGAATRGGLDRRPDAPLLALVSRLTSQKGLDLVLGALPGFLRAETQLMVVGTGDVALENAFRDACKAHPGRVAVRLVYDEVLAHPRHRAVPTRS